MMFNATLCLTYAAWDKSVEDGTLAEKRDNVERIAREVSRTIGPQMEKVIQNMLIYGSANIVFDEFEVKVLDPWEYTL